MSSNISNLIIIYIIINYTVIYTYLVIIIFYCLQTYVAECLGVHFVGYVIMVFALSSSVGSIICGRILGYVNYNIVVIVNAAFHAGTIVFLTIWEREPNFVVLFLIPIICGICVGAWLAISYSKLLLYQVTVATYICTCYMFMVIQTSMYYVLVLPIIILENSFKSINLIASF